MRFGIESNIDSHGYQLTIVSGSSVPRYAYTVGLFESIGFELVMAGGYFFSISDLEVIFEKLITHIQSDSEARSNPIAVDDLGIFSFRKVHSSWVGKFLYGIVEFYGAEDVSVVQILPDQLHHTLEIPQMELNCSVARNIWEYEQDQPRNSNALNPMVATTIQVLQGEPILEVTRWEPDYLEMWQCPPDDLIRDDIRIIPFLILVKIDPTIEDALRIEVGKGLWRDRREGVWHNWG